MAAAQAACESLSPATDRTVNALGNQTEDLNWLHDYSPFSWAYGADPLTDGWHWRQNLNP
ncbi:hypothetical protein [Agromyces ramosus]|uniref:hypothetical protein n=1 Tax=Agromyces ramosus TaxID=33879 RepID=UPI001A93A2EB|nr:hypothetical protein [Agromyces ramosus]